VPSFSLAPRMASRSSTFRRSSTYGRTKSSGRVVAALIAASNATRLTPALSRSRYSLARSSIHVVTSVSAGPPSGGLYLSPPSAGGLCDGVMMIPSAGAPAVVGEDRPRDGRRRGRPVVALDDRAHPVGREHLQGRPLGRAGQAVRVLAHEERAVDPAAAAVVADGLGDRQDVRLGEGAPGGRPAVAAGAEADELVGVVHVRTAVVVLPLEPGRVDEQPGRGGLAREWGGRHGPLGTGTVRRKAAYSGGRRPSPVTSRRCGRKN